MTDTIFEADELAADAVTAQPDPELQEQQQDGRARDEQGRFAPKTDEQQQEGEQTDEERARQVPHAALHAEREKRREIEGKYKTAQATLDAIAQMRAQAAGRKPQEQTPAPVAEDPAAEMDHLRRRLAELEGSHQQRARQEEIAQVDQLEMQHIGSIMHQSEAEFRASTPDYDAAVEHVVSARARELEIYGLNPMQVEQTIRAEVADIARAAVQQGRSPAEVAYQLAKLRGYRGQASEQQTGQSPAARTVAAVGAAQARSRSLGQASGGGSTKEINAQTIAAMGIDEFDALYSTPEGRKLIDAL